MYKTFYQFKENPFNITADPAFFFPSAHHEEAFSHLLYGIHHRKGILLISGDIGTGKTTLCRALINAVDKNTRTALILNPSFSEIQLLQLILNDLGIKCRKDDKLSLVAALNTFLLKESAKGNNVAVIIDESQNLSIEQLEQIRLLSNLETEKQKLLQIVLSGQPELFDKLRDPKLAQLNQRIAVRYHILPLEPHEVNAYILHRITVALCNTAGNMISFTAKALEAIYVHSRGIPRLINIICDRALLAGFTAESRIIDERMINLAARELR